MPKAKTIVQNEMKNVGNETDFNDKDILMDVLTSCKALLNIYYTYISETSNKTLYDKIQILSKEINDIQREVFNLLFELGWYKIEAEPKTKIQKKYKTLTNLKKQLD